MDVRVGLCGWTVSQAAYVRSFSLLEVQHMFSQVERPAGRLLWDLAEGRPSPYVLFNNLPRTGDAERFRALL